MNKLEPIFLNFAVLSSKGIHKYEKLLLALNAADTTQLLLLAQGLGQIVDTISKL